MARERGSKGIPSQPYKATMRLLSYFFGMCQILNSTTLLLGHTLLIIPSWNMYCTGLLLHKKYTTNSKCYMHKTSCLWHVSCDLQHVTQLGVIHALNLLADNMWHEYTEVGGLEVQGPEFHHINRWTCLPWGTGRGWAHTDNTPWHCGVKGRRWREHVMNTGPKLLGLKYVKLK